MAFGFPASYETQRIRAGSRQAARDAITYSFEILEWRYDVVTVDLFRAVVPMTSMSWGEIFTVSLDTPDVIEIKSSSSYPLQVFDWGKNRQNVDNFIAYFEPKELREAMLRSGEAAYLDEAGTTPVGRLHLDK